MFAGTSATLTSLASGNGVVRYQWRFEGANLPNATNASLTLSNISSANHGNYSVLASDSASTAISSNAFVFVLIKPGIVVAPLPQTVLQGGTAIFSCLATGQPPLFYRWISNNAQFLVSTSSLLVLTNVQPRTPPVLFRVIVTNTAGSTIATGSTNVALTVLLDFDRDGMADAWEFQFGFNTNNAADALLDFDGDRMSNRDEYTAGTNPTNALSYLKLILSETSATELNFIAQSNLSYTVQWRTNLIAPGWSNLTSIMASPLVRTVQVNTALAPPGAQHYYRLVTPLTP